MKSRVCIGLAVGIVVYTAPAWADTPVGGPICTDTTWDQPGSPYVVTVAAGGSIVVGCDATLTIEPGVEVRFEPELGLLVGWSAWAPGTLVARGTEPSPILFTSDQPSPAPGDWSRIEFLDQATDATFDGSENYQSGCILEQVIVEYAGSGNYAAVNVDQSAPYFSYCEVRANLKRGIAASSAPPMRIENCHVHENRDGGMYFNGGSNTLTRNTVSDNSTGGNGGGIYFSSSPGSNTLTVNTISSNSATHGDGGGIDFYSSGSNTLTGNTIEENTAGGEGGAMHLYNSDDDAFAGNTIRFNHTTYGQTGGIFVTNGSEWLSLNGGPEAYNTVCWNDGYEVYNNNPFYGDGRNDIDARNVFWDTNDAAVIQAEIYDFDDDASKAMVLWYPFVPPGDRPPISWQLPLEGKGVDVR